MYSMRHVKLGWFEIRQQNFVVCKPNVTSVSAFGVESIVVVNAFFPFIDIYVLSRDIRDQNLKLSVNARTLNVG